jgi:hypothetical protein
LTIADDSPTVDRTLAQIAGFRQALANTEQDKPGKRAAAIRGSCQGMIRQLEEELPEYDPLKSGEFELPDIQRLDQIAPFITKIRIAKGGLADWEAAEDP